jgi:alpha-L-fucosidase
MTMTPVNLPDPTPAQRRWMELRSGLFLHFGINTFYDVEWSDGTLDPTAYNPTELDTDEWCHAAHSAGMRFVVLVAKHHDGFCNWPTAHTEYCVRNTPFGGDLVRSVTESARKYGLEVGLYYSLWDRHEPSHDRNDATYAAFMKAQLTELLTGYGPIVELWFDGMWKKQKSGWDGDAAAFQDAWREEGAKRWHWDDLYAHIKSLQPDCIVLNNTTTRFPCVPLMPVDARPGEKATNDNESAVPAADQTLWHWNGDEIYLPLQIETTLSQKGPSGDFASGSWFWHPWDHSVATVEQVRQWQQDAREKNAVLLLNAGLMASGRLRPEDTAVLARLRQNRPETEEKTAY